MSDGSVVIRIAGEASRSSSIAESVLLADGTLKAGGASICVGSTTDRFLSTSSLRAASSDMAASRESFGVKDDDEALGVGF